MKSDEPRKSVVTGLSHEQLTKLVEWEGSDTYKIIKEVLVTRDLEETRVILMGADLTSEISNRLAENRGKLKRGEQILKLPELARQELAKLRTKDNGKN